MTDKELFEFIDVEEMLTELGLRNVRDKNNGEIEYSCPFEGHSHLDTNPSASMTTVERHNPNGGVYPKTSFYCFGCGKSGTAISFLAEFEGVSPITAKRWLRERFADEYENEPSDLVAKIEDIFNIPERKQAQPLKIIPESEVEERALDWIAVYMEWIQTHNSPYPFNYMFDRGFEPEYLEHFDIGFDDKSKRFSIPIRDEWGQLVGFKGRAWWDDAKPKYLSLGGEGYNFDTLEHSRVLFALDKAKQHIESRSEGLIVREGELNAMAMHQKGWPNTVGVSGCNLSQTQVDIIKRHTDRVCLYFDRYSDGLKAADKLIGHLRVSICQDSPKDPADSETIEISNVLLNRVGGIEATIMGLC